LTVRRKLVEVQGVLRLSFGLILGLLGGGGDHRQDAAGQGKRHTDSQLNFHIQISIG
jgi:hypothetical protein